MKKNVLIIYGYDRIAPPFMRSIIKFADRKFDEVIYITAPISTDDVKAVSYPNVKIVMWNKSIRFKQYVRGVFSVFRKQLWREVNKGPISIGAIKNASKMFFCSDGFLMMSSKYIRNAIAEGANVFLLGTWMDVDAFTAARVKTEYPQVRAYALAHSGEVMVERNPYINQSFKDYCFEHLDKVYFISKIVRDNYIKDMKSIKDVSQIQNKSEVHYLGSIKTSDSMNPKNKGQKLYLLSCSRIDDNKRLSKVISALKCWKGGKIKWTHIGTGVLEESIKSEASQLVNDNPLIEVEFTGRLNNPQVTDYYGNNPVDLFVNVSRSEGLPISIMEAMSYGIPCIATNVGGTSEIVNESNGFLMDKDFSDCDFNNIISSFISMSDSERESMRCSAFKTWSSKFNAEVNADNMFLKWLGDK